MADGFPLKKFVDRRDYKIWESGKRYGRRLEQFRRAEDHEDIRRLCEAWLLHTDHMDGCQCHPCRAARKFVNVGLERDDA